MNYFLVKVSLGICPVCGYARKLFIFFASYFQSLAHCSFTNIQSKSNILLFPTVALKFQRMNRAVFFPIC